MAQPLTIAHRGARSLAPENTLAAARKALELGADMWELDVGVTADGVLIVMHDHTLSRTTNADRLFPERAPWRVTDFTLAEIKQLDAGSFFVARDPFEQIGAGLISAAEQTALRGEPVPTLEEALRFTRDHGWRVNVEIKGLTAPLENFPVAEKVVALIDEALDMVDQVLVSSFVPLYLQQVRQRCPAIELAVLTDGPLSPKYLRAYPGFATVEAVPPHVYFDGDGPVGFVAGLGAGTYHPHYSLISPALVDALHAAGVQLNAWTVNDRAHMARLADMGVDGLITDFPQYLTTRAPGAAAAATPGGRSADHAAGTAAR